MAIKNPHIEIELEKMAYIWCFGVKRTQKGWGISEKKPLMGLSGESTITFYWLSDYTISFEIN